MKSTTKEELLACVLQLNADIEELLDVIDYIQPIHERIKTLTEILEKERKSA